MSPYKESKHNDPVRIHTHVDPDIKNKLLELGHGCLKDGIELAVKEYYKKEITVTVITELKI